MITPGNLIFLKEIIIFVLLIFSSCATYAVNPSIMNYSPSGSNKFSGGVNIGYGMMPLPYISLKPSQDVELHGEMLSNDTFALSLRFTYQKKKNTYLSSGFCFSKINALEDLPSITWMEAPFAATYRSKLIIMWFDIKPGIAEFSSWSYQDPLTNGTITVNPTSAFEITFEGGIGYAPSNGLQILFGVNYPIVAPVEDFLVFPFPYFSFSAGYNF